MKNTPNSDNPIMFMNELTKLFLDEIRNKSLKTGMRGAYFPFLRLVASESGRTQHSFCNDTHMKASTVSTTLANMETDGLIERRQDKNDLRTVRIYITEKGMQMHEKIHAIIKESEGIALEGLSSEEIDFLMKSFEKIRNNLLRRDICD